MVRVVRRFQLQLSCTPRSLLISFVSLAEVGMRSSSRASALEDQRPCGKVSCSFSVEAFVCFNFGSLASYWPRSRNDFGVPLGSGRPPNGGPGAAKRQPRRPKPRPWGACGVPLGAGGPPEGAGSFQETTQATNMGLPPQRCACVLKTSKHYEN